jgi:hypothetical protein
VSPSFFTIGVNPTTRWSTVKTVPEASKGARDAEVVVEESPPTGAERSHVRLVAGDPPMLRLEINLYSPIVH